MELKDPNGLWSEELEYFMHTDYMPFINSLVRVKSNRSGNDGGWGAFEPHWWGAGSSSTEQQTRYSTCFTDFKEVKSLYILFLHLKLFEQDYVTGRLSAWL